VKVNKPIQQKKKTRFSSWSFKDEECWFAGDMQTRRDIHFLVWSDYIVH
jgi:hypothetical protein